MMIKMHRGVHLATLSIALSGAPALAQSAPTPPQPTSSPVRVATTRMARPTGWIGLSYSAGASMDVRSGGTVAYSTYPVVEAVVPGSPADKAGIQIGDTLVAFNGRDFRADGVPFATMLRPGEKIAVRYKRGRRERRATVTVGEPRGGYSYSFTAGQPGAGDLRAFRFDSATQREFDQFGEKMRTFRFDSATMRGFEQFGFNMARAQTQQAVELRQAAQAAAALEREFLMNPPATPMVAFAWPSGAMAIAGAEVVRVNEDLGAVLGVSRGVLVVNVAPGTAADNAGLRGGDVIISSEYGNVMTPGDFQRAVARATQSKRLRLSVVRRGKSQGITIRL